MYMPFQVWGSDQYLDISETAAMIYKSDRPQLLTFKHITQGNDKFQQKVVQRFVCVLLPLLKYVVTSC